MRRLLIILFIAAPVFGQVRRIEFRSRIPANVLLSQSGLTADREYSDAELQLALARLRRLPFVYAASYTIEGSTIVFNIADEYRVFYHFDANGQTVRSGGGGGGFINADVGGRYYLPWGGVAKASFGAESQRGDRGSAWTLEYGQYGILGSRLFVIVDALLPSQGSKTQPGGTIGYPIGLRQTVSVRGFRSHFEDRENFGVASHFDSSGDDREVALAWEWNTTNDPLYVTRGADFIIERGRSKTANTAASFGSKGLIFSSEQKTDLDTWRGVARKYWPMGGRGAITANVEMTRSTGDLHFRSNPTAPFGLSNTSNQRTVATVGYAYNFFPLISELRDTRHRVELSAGIDGFNDKTGQQRSSRTFSTAQLGYVFRNRWGNFRLVLSYLGDD